MHARCDERNATTINAATTCQAVLLQRKQETFSAPRLQSCLLRVLSVLRAGVCVLQAAMRGCAPPQALPSSRVRHSRVPSVRRVRARRTVVHAKAGGLVTVVYRTDWETCSMHWTDGGEWRDVAMEASSVPGWRSVTVQAAGAVEFVMKDGAGRWDNPLGVSGRNYVAACAGKYKLQASELLLLPPNLPVLLVSDLDGTMVGDDAATRAFATFWAHMAAPAGSKLVYSTGRSLASFLELAKDKGAETLLKPDVLICSVGTKVYLPAEDGGWAEDPAWTSRLDEGWNEGQVRGFATEAVQLVGNSSAHWRPEEEQNGHKVTLGVKEGEAAEGLQAHVRSSLAQAGLSAKVVASGTGGWRYVDIVSAQAGKLESLEYVRTMLGFECDQTVAAGDSGNDILMLSGRNRAVVVGNAQPDLAAWAQAQLGLEPPCEVEGDSSGDDQDDESLMTPQSLSARLIPDGALVDVVDVEVTAVSEVVTLTVERPVDTEPLPTAPATPLVAVQPQPDCVARLYVAKGQQAWGIVEGLQHFGCA